MIIHPLHRARVPGLRPGQEETPPPAGGFYSADPKVIETEVAALAATYTQMGVPLDADTSEARATEQIDPDVMKAQASAINSLDSSVAAGVVQESGVTVAALQARTEQAGHFLRINGLAADAEARAQDGQRVMARVQRDLRAAMSRKAALLAKGLPLEEQRELESHLLQIQLELAQTQAEKQAQTHKTSADTASSAAQRAAQTQREQMLHTVINLKAGGSATAEEVQAAYDELMGATSDRRSGGR